MVKPFRLTYLAKGWWRGVASIVSLNVVVISMIRELLLINTDADLTSLDLNMKIDRRPFYSM